MDINLVASEPIPKYMERFIDFFAGIKVSLRTKIMLSFFVVISMLVAGGSVPMGSIYPS